MTTGKSASADTQGPQSRLWAEVLERLGPDFNTLQLRIWSLFLDIKCHAKLNLFLL